MNTKLGPLLTKILIILAISVVIALPGSSMFPLEISLLYGGVTGILVIFLFIINEFLLIPRYFFKRSKLPFVLLNALLLAVVALFHFLFDIEFINPQKIYDPGEGPPIAFFAIRSIVLFLMADFICITLYLANTVKKQAIREKTLKEEKLGTEIKLLKAQINPHFIFNALNNIYSLTYTQSEKAPESVLKLSEMLRYVFYDCNKDVVKLTDEIEYINNFIAFQQLKSEHEQDIVFDYRNISQDTTIAPMLFTPFIENAFKYSKISEDSRAFVKITMTMDKGVLYTTVENSIPQSGKPISGQGFGIPNVRQRLNVLYPEQHELHINENEEIFTVKLKIRLK